MSVNDFMKRVQVTIEGCDPGYIQQGKGLMAAREDAGSKGCNPFNRQQEAEMLAHWTTVNRKKQLAIPWVQLYKSICESAKNFKHGKKSAATLIASTIACETDMIPLGTDKFEVYVEWVRIPPRTGSMVRLGRPRMTDWKATFTMIVDAEMYKDRSLGDLRRMVEDAGKLVGIGAWRPQLKGPYGKFRVVEFKIL